MPARQHPDQQGELVDVQARDEPCELVGGGCVAIARAAAQRDRALVHGERLRALGGADHLLQHAAEQRLVADESVAGSVAERGDGGHAQHAIAQRRLVRRECAAVSHAGNRRAAVR